MISESQIDSITMRLRRVLRGPSKYASDSHYTEARHKLVEQLKTVLWELGVTEQELSRFKVDDVV